MSSEDALPPYIRFKRLRTEFISKTNSHEQFSQTIQREVVAAVIVRKMHGAATILPLNQGSVHEN